MSKHDKVQHVTTILKLGLHSFVMSDSLPQRQTEIEENRGTTLFVEVCMRTESQERMLRNIESTRAVTRTHGTWKHPPTYRSIPRDPVLRYLILSLVH